MRSSKDLVEGEIYEILNPHFSFRFLDHLGWFDYSRVPKEPTTLFVYLEQDGDYAIFLTSVGRIHIARAYARHLRPIKKDKNLGQ